MKNKNHIITITIVFETAAVTLKDALRIAREELPRLENMGHTATVVNEETGAELQVNEF